MELNHRNGVLGLLRWAVHCPGYFLVRVATGNRSEAEVRYHRRRRVNSISSAIRIPIAEVESILHEVESSERIRSLERSVGDLPYSGIFRGGPELYTILRVVKPTKIVETGVGTGYSSSYILEALERNGLGQLTSIDQPNEDVNWHLPEGREPGFLVAQELRHRWKLVLGRTSELLPSILTDLGSLDVFFHDSEHTYDVMKFEYDHAARRLRAGGLLVSDDAMWNTALLDFAREEKLRIHFIYHRGGSAPFTVVRMNRHDDYGPSERSQSGV